MCSEWLTFPIECLDGQFDRQNKKNLPMVTGAEHNAEDHLRYAKNDRRLHLVRVQIRDFVRGHLPRGIQTWCEFKNVYVHTIQYFVLHTTSKLENNALAKKREVKTEPKSKTQDRKL